MSTYLFLFAPWYASHLRVQLQVFARCEGVVQCVELGTVSESLLYSAQVFQNTVPLKKGFSRGRSKVTGQHLEGRRLTSSIHSKQAETFALRNA